MTACYVQKEQNIRAVGRHGMQLACMATILGEGGGGGGGEVVLVLELDCEVKGSNDDNVVMETNLVRVRKE